IDMGASSGMPLFLQKSTSPTATKGQSSIPSQEAQQEQEMLALPSKTGKGTPHHIAVSGNGNNVRLEGRTDANFDGGTFTVPQIQPTLGSNCTGCPSADCLHVVGNVISTFSVTTTVTLPSISDFPNLTPCQKERVQNAIDTVLAPHEQEHVQAFQTYNGTVTTPFDRTLCRDAFDTEMQAIHDQVESDRRKAAQESSDALDPFHFDVDINLFSTLQ
ncbi:MAG: hypothetical protein AB4042_05585, partial [Leptolyngbyaceae cyanobacterium]